MDIMQLKSVIRDINDFPKKGIIFRDITPMLSCPEAFSFVIDFFYDNYKDKNIDKILAIESRGFIFGAPLAYRLNCGLNLFRKPGKLPFKTLSHTYELEYGSDSIEIHEDAIKKGDNILIIDDLLATGGTASAAASLASSMGASLISLGFVIELSFLNGREKLKDYNILKILDY